jgi:hypothetical protein
LFTLFGLNLVNVIPVFLFITHLPTKNLSMWHCTLSSLSSITTWGWLPIGISLFVLIGRCVCCCYFAKSCFCFSVPILVK